MFPKLTEESASPAYIKVNDRWEVAVGIADGAFTQVSFVNGICTSKGGSHVKHVADQVVKALTKSVKSKNKKGAAIKPAIVRGCVYY